MKERRSKRMKKKRKRQKKRRSKLRLLRFLLTSKKHLYPITFKCKRQYKYDYIYKQLINKTFNRYPGTLFNRAYI